MAGSDARRSGRVRQWEKDGDKDTIVERLLASVRQGRQGHNGN